MAMKKKFISVELPLVGENVLVLGTEESLDKRTIKLDLSRKLRGRSLEAVFVIKNMEGKLFGFPKKLELMKQYILRMMRKRINYVEDSFEAQCKDISCRIKPFLITRKKVSRAIRNNLRKTAKEFLIEFVKERTYLEVCELVLHAELQKEMIPKLKKVYPLAMCEIRVLETASLKDADLTVKEREVKEKKSVQEDEEVETTEEPVSEQAEIVKEEKEEVKVEKPKKKSSKKTKEE